MNASVFPPFHQIVGVGFVDKHVDMSAASRSYFLRVDVLEAIAILLINPLEPPELCRNYPLHVLGVFWPVLTEVQADQEVSVFIICVHESSESCGCSPLIYLLDGLGCLIHVWGSWYPL